MPVPLGRLYCYISTRPTYLRINTELTNLSLQYSPVPSFSHLTAILLRLSEGGLLGFGPAKAATSV